MITVTHRTRAACGAVPSTFYIASGAGKLVGLQRSLQIRDKVGFPAAGWRVLGVSEIGFGVGSLVADRRIELVSKLSLMLLSTLAIVTHLRKRDAVALAIPAALSFALLGVSALPPEDA